MSFVAVGWVRRMSHALTALALVPMAFACAPSASAATIASYQAGVPAGGTNAQAPGQEVTTPSGGPWSDIAFNFYDYNGAAYAPETVYLLSQAYGGDTSGLSSATPGFIAEAVGSGGVYSFASSVTLKPGTSYYFYDSFLPPSERGYVENFDPIGSGFQGYGAGNGGNLSYSPRPFALAYSLTGTVTAGVPEPSTWALMLIGFAGLGAAVRFKRKSGVVPA